MKNTVNAIKDHDIKTIYFNCFDTWLEIKNPGLWREPLMDDLNVSQKVVRNFLLLQNKELREILLEQMPYIENNIKKMDALRQAEEKIQQEINSIQLKPGAARILPELQERGYKVGMISNIAKAYVPKVLELAPITFDYMLLSCKIAKKKTWSNTDIYQQAHKLTNNNKREIVMIGDNTINDCDVAEGYGFHTIHMDWKKRNSSPHRVHTLEQLLDLFPDKR